MISRPLNKFIAKVPTEQDKFMLLLELHAILLFALFMAECNEEFS
jgi:hypothetical protein